MHHSQTYPVTESNGKPVARPGPQSKPKPKETLECSYGMCVGIFVGCVAIAFLAYVYGFPNPLVPKATDPFKGLGPLIQEGNLVVYPTLFDPENNPVVNGSYFITFTPQVVKKTVKDIQRILDTYPRDWKKNHTQCWVQHPNYDKPCFFDITWLGDDCTQAQSFGFQEEESSYNPCIFLRLEMTDNWKPIPDKVEDLPSEMKDDYDPSFTRMFCRPEFPRDADKFQEIAIVPPKGFSTLYFPISNFTQKNYLAPIVIIRVLKLKKGINVTLECGLMAENSMMLHNRGYIKLTFST